MMTYYLMIAAGVTLKLWVEHGCDRPVRCLFRGLFWLPTAITKYIGK